MSEPIAQAGDGNFKQIVSESALLQKPMECSAGMVMGSWLQIFEQSRVNNGAYDGDRLPAQNWYWPQGTWFQTRLRNLRKGNGTTKNLLND
ncbi:MAG TPA: hypothetical protein VLJ79_23640 [Candidatus Binatia bacterium]|nr:hypothetical protein [Candidatus Binatia bacterium]